MQLFLLNKIIVDIKKGEAIHVKQKIWLKNKCIKKCWFKWKKCTIMKHTNLSCTKFGYRDY